MIVRFARIASLTAVLLAALVSAAAHGENAHKSARRLARWYTWHGRHYHTEYGSPVALVVPPTASLETNWGWGVGNTRVSRINHQFGRPYGVPNASPQGFFPTPPWPSDTNQFGVYYVRGPW